MEISDIGFVIFSNGGISYENNASGIRGDMVRYGDLPVLFLFYFVEYVVLYVVRTNSEKCYSIFMFYFELE